MPRALALGLALCLALILSPLAAGAPGPQGEPLVLHSAIGDIGCPGEEELARLESGAQGELPGMAASAREALQRIERAAREAERLRLSVLSAPVDRSEYQDQILRLDERYQSGEAALDPALDPEAQTESLTRERAAATEALSRASADLQELRAALERSPAQAAQYRRESDELSSALLAIGDPSDTRARLIAPRLLAIERERDLMARRAAARDDLMELAELRLRLATLRQAQCDAALSAIEGARQEREAATLRERNALARAHAGGVTALEKEYDKNEVLIDLLADSVGGSRELDNLLGEVDEALETLRQVGSNTDELVQGLKGTVLLSRLLNRKQAEIPTLELGIDLDELIPRLNLSLFDLHALRDEYLGSADVGEAYVSHHPSLRPHLSAVREMVRVRKGIVDRLVSIQEARLGSALELRAKAGRLAEQSQSMRSRLSEHMFWIESNPPFGLAFIMSVPHRLWSQAQRFLDEFSPQVVALALGGALPFWGALAALAALVLLYRKRLRAVVAGIDARLGTADDGYLLTPLRILIALVRSIPLTTLLVTGCGALILTLAGGGGAHTTAMLPMLSLHVLAFVFFTRILRQGGLARVHFGTGMRQVAFSRDLLIRIGLSIVPILVLSNVCALDYRDISSDTLGPLLILCCCLGLAATLIRGLRQYREIFHETSWFSSLCLLLAGTAALGMLALVLCGYYFTALNLVSHIALTLYVALTYLLVMELICRELSV
ncbi:MAG: hypothetical protein K6A65_05280, partial [Succinivibrionaceae bacterium]|nr:hypothetical protein [Succinivibrionaceae bacterium]